MASILRIIRVDHLLGQGACGFARERSSQDKLGHEAVDRSGALAGLVFTSQRDAIVIVCGGGRQHTPDATADGAADRLIDNSNARDVTRGRGVGMGDIRPSADGKYAACCSLRGTRGPSTN